jgi:dTDP-4-amino-4,6-dideoxy-D-galactose acyltransferase
MKTKILFRCDGGMEAEIGTGHVARDSRIAQELEKYGDIEIGFVMADNAFSRNFRKSSKWPVYLFEEASPSSCEKAIGEFSADILVVDCLDSDPAFMKKARQHCSVLVTMDDTGPGANEADVVINAIRNGYDTPYSGPRYAIVPKEISALRTIRPECRSIFVSFGGYDHLNLTLKAAMALESLETQVEIRLVVGPAYPHWEALNAFLKGSKRKFAVHNNPENYNQLLCSSDMAITNGGLSSFEAMSAGLPCIVIAQYAHQAATGKKYHNEGAVDFIDLGSHVGEGEILARVRRLMGDFDLRARMSRTAQGVVDGDGLIRVAEAIRILQRKEWDSGFFGINIASMNVVRINGRIAAFSDRWCKKNNIACLFYLCDCNHAMSVRCAEASGYGFKDIRMVFEMRMDHHISHGMPSGVSECAAEDLAPIREIAEISYIQSRYYYDGNFDVGLLRKFYSNWLVNTFNSPRGKIFVARDGAGRAFGYISGETDNEGRVGRIILVGVDGEHARSGIGKSLVDAMVDWMRGKKVYTVEVITQGRNIGAQRLYQKCGFRIASLSLWYHKWFELPKKQDSG